jgi:hypothetical protein
MEIINGYTACFFVKITLVNNKMRRTCMQQKQAKENVASIMRPKFAGTDAQKVKQEIQKDVSQGRGAMTSREAGAMQD